MKSFFNLISLLLLSSIVFAQSTQHAISTDSIQDSSYLRKIKFITHLGVDSSYFGKDFPKVEGLNLIDSVVTNDSLKPIVLYKFWFTACNPCVYEMPIMDSLAHEFQDSIDFIAITFNTKEELIPFFEEHTLDFKHIIMERKSLENLGVTRGYPTTVITRNNKIIYWKSGGQTSDSPYGTDVINAYYEYLRGFLKSQLKHMQ